MKDKETAVEWFAIALYEKGFLTGNGDEIQGLLEQAKEMEKEQMEEAFENGVNDEYEWHINNKKRN
jgi:hypothetical protein